MRAADQDARAAGGTRRGCGSRRARARRPARRPAKAPAARRRGRHRRARSGRAPAPRPRRRPACRSSTSAILTVYSSRPARNSRVPSSGSTRSEASAESRDRPGSGALLRHHRHAGQQPRQPVQDDRLRGLVGGGDRRAIGLVARDPGSRRGTARMAAARARGDRVRPSSSPRYPSDCRRPRTMPHSRRQRQRFITSPAHARRPNRLNVPSSSLRTRRTHPCPAPSLSKPSISRRCCARGSATT